MPQKTVFGETYTGKLRTIIDPSAASFITLLRKKGKYTVISADNDVLDGIRDTAVAMQTGLIKISPKIEEWRKEAEGYVFEGWFDEEGNELPENATADTDMIIYARYRKDQN